jgi:hypothetical protein
MITSIILSSGQNLNGSIKQATFLFVSSLKLSQITLFYFKTLLKTEKSSSSFNYFDNLSTAS